ncbi:N-acetylmuramoyl-L-alanine amidase [Clostridium cylindrosporum]|uniref:Endolysin CS74L n=1 Tax=Clostridium cylindrosporum DSM 605 TaxID=1121307 RepID=A0A0J8D691_CLOCY|nr:N-acetylmuramoyl-L-alanine amidase [Clostridium cylindrosporum]KMT21610.1 endolysin CS74L [Clostridium cylindrosporum DSM 605]
MIIGIDMGHTLEGSNYGAIGVLKESEETRRLGNKVIKYLNQLGHTVVNCTIDRAASNTESLFKRVSKANAQSLDLFVSIHLNSGGGCGTEVFTYSGKQHLEAIRVLDKMNSIGFVNRGVKDGSSLYVVKNTRAKSMLVEVCFVDNIEDVNLYKDNINSIAKSIAEGITGQIINDIESEDDEMIPGTVKLAACSYNPIAKQMVEEIKILQGVMGLSKDGVATEELIKKLPQLIGIEARGVVTVMQRILIMKGFLSKGSDTGIMGPANRDAINKFKISTGIPFGYILINNLTWRKLLEY